MVKDHHPYKVVGNRLRALRGKLTQKEFSKNVGLSLSAYQRYEYGERLPGLEALIKIAAFCGVSEDEILPEFPGMVFDPKNPRRLENIKDGFSETISAIQKKGIKYRELIGEIDFGAEHYHLDHRIDDMFNKIYFVLEKGSKSLVDALIDTVNSFATAASNFPPKDKGRS